MVKIETKEKVIEYLKADPLDYYNSEGHTKESSYEFKYVRLLSDGVTESREIGSVNVVLAASWMAFNEELVLSGNASVHTAMWMAVMNDLEENNLLRRIPEKIRKQFKVV